LIRWRDGIARAGRLLTPRLFDWACTRIVWTRIIVHFSKLLCVLSHFLASTATDWKKRTVNPRSFIVGCHSRSAERTDAFPPIAKHESGTMTLCAADPSRPASFVMAH
jgi:hypothetical protein